ncbi:MAG: STM4014 family protein [Lysobacterales bacterium]
MSATLCLIDAVPGGVTAGLAPSLLARRQSQAQAMTAAGGKLIPLEYRQAWQLQSLPAADAYKFDAPGQNEALDHWFLQLGAPQGADAGDMRARDAGEIHQRRAWFKGFTQVLCAIAAKGLGPRWLNTVDSILAMTDTLECQQRLHRQGLAVPALLGEFDNFEDLRQRMEDTGCERVFVKPRYGSSGSGVIALRRWRDRWQATSGTVLREGRPGNSLRVLRQSCPRRIGALVDALAAASPCYAEHWIPKPRAPGGLGACWDLRVVAWRGQARQRIARVSQHPICNLHLGNQRATPCWLSSAQIEQVEHSISAIASAFPGAQVFGADLIVKADRVIVLEVNAFGDHLREVHLDGRSSHDDQAHELCATADLATCA